MTSTLTDTLMTSEASSQPQLVIWGTNVNMHKVKIKFQEFIKVYMLHDEREQKEFANEGIDISEPYYMQKLEEVWQANLFDNSSEKLSFKLKKCFLFCEGISIY